MKLSDEVLKSAFSIGATTEIAPLTIFYDGKITIFDVSSDKVEDILKFADKSKIMNPFSSKKQLFVETLSGDILGLRKNSLLRFMEKRKERLYGGSENGMKIVLLTICYNEMVTNFTVSSDKANDILKFAERLKIMDALSSKQQLSMETLSGDLPLARRNSLLRFSEKRKTRLDCGSENDIEIAPLTIFYNGITAVFDVSSDKAANILKFAERSKIRDACSSKKQLFVKPLSGDIHLARRNSILRFLEKRKARLCSGSKNGTKIMPLTIFYNETVAVFDASSEKVEDILKFVEWSKVQDVLSQKNQML